MSQKYPLITAVWEQNRSRIIIIMVLLLLITAIFIGQKWVSEPNLLQLRAEQSRLQQHVRKRQAEFANSGVPVSVAAQIEKNLQQFDHLIPAQTDFSDFIGEIFEWAEQADLKIHQISYQPEHEKKTDFLRYGLSFSVQGDYSQIKKFIYFLENSQRILLVKKIALRGTPNPKENQHEVNLRIDLATYFQGGTV